MNWNQGWGAVGVGTLTKPKLLKIKGKKRCRERRYKTNWRTRENLINRKKKREPRGEKKNERMAVGCRFSPTTENTTGNAKSIQINIYINHQELRKAVSDRPSCRNRVNCRVCWTYRHTRCPKPRRWMTPDRQAKATLPIRWIGDGYQTPLEARGRLNREANWKGFSQSLLWRREWQDRLCQDLEERCRPSLMQQQSGVHQGDKLGRGEAEELGCTKMQINARCQSALEME